MKKIFLTSGLVICMACPTVASATGAGFVKTSIDQTGSGSSATFSANTAGTGNLSNYANINTATNKDVANACVTDILGTSSDGGTATLQAQWTPNFSTITLDKNTSANGYGSGSVAPTPIYGIPNATSVYTTKDANGNLGSAKVANDQLLNSTTGIPTGKAVKHTLNYNWSSISNAGGALYNYNATTSGKFTAGTSSTVNRTFKGIYSAATGGTQYIDADGKILANGITAAKGYAANAQKTWYAQYNCATPKLTNPTLLGYTFEGWYKEAALTNAYTSCITADDTIYAKWTPKTYTVTYNANKPTAASGVTLGNVTGMPASGSAPLSATFDRGYTAASAPSLTGYTFDGWKANYVITTGATAGTASAPTQGYGAGEVIANPSASTPTRWKTDADVTFVAQWVAKNYTITLDKKGGASQGSIALYTKYNTNLYSDANRTSAFTTSSSITKPTGPATTLSYDLHLPINPRAATPNTAYTTPATPASTTVNRAFSGYNDSGGTQRINSSGKMTSDNITWAKGLTADTTLTAQWGNAAHTTAAAQSLTGYTFDGWYPTYSNGTVSGTKVNPSSTYNLTDNKTLHAQWTANSGKIRFNCGKQADGTTNVTGDGPYDMTWRYDSQVTGFPLTVTTTECSYPGYVFAGWDCSDNISTIGNPETATGHYIYRAETTTNSSTGAVRGVISEHNPNTGWYYPTNPTNGSDIICTALWMPGSITVKWNTNNGSPASIADGSCTYDSSVTLPTNPTRTGYIFNGWNVQ